MNRESEKYTKETGFWLDQRFDLFDSEGAYIPNQPAYGFSALAFRLEEYARMFAVLKTLNQLPFDSLLDLGCADGFGPGIIRHLFDCDVVGLDLSSMAMVRSRELFSVPGAAADAHFLPFSDNSFDVSICTEVLEHVVDPEKVVSELCRVSRRFVVLSTPRAPNIAIQQEHFANLDPNEPHAHIHFFTDAEIRTLCGSNAWFKGARTRAVNSLLDRLAWADKGTYIQRKSYYDFTVNSSDLGENQRKTMRSMLIDRYEDASKWKMKLVRPLSVGQLLRLDAAIASWFPATALDHLVVISTGDDTSWTMSKVNVRRILSELLGGFSVMPLRRTRL